MIEQLDIDKIEEELNELGPWLSGILITDKDILFMRKSKERIAALVKRVRELEQEIADDEDYVNKYA